MALYSCSISNIKRSDGRSSVAKAAYNSRDELLDERTNNKYDYSQKLDLGFSEIITPLNAPAWASDRQQLWSKNELVNKRRDSRVAKEILVALPRELDKNQQFNLVHSFVTNNLTPLGVVADVNAHELEATAEPDWNPHVHILITTNHIVDGEFGSKITELNKKEFVTNLRKAWAEETNSALEKAGEKVRVDHRSNEARGIERIPQIHLGHKVWAMKEKGIATERGDRYREIKERNQKIDKINAQQLDSQRLSGLDVVRNSMAEFMKASEECKPLKKKSWLSKAKDFVFGSEKDKQDLPRPIAKTPKVEETAKDFSSNLDYQSRAKCKSRYSDVSKTEEQKLALAESLVKGMDNQSEINKQLRIKPGKLVVLVNKNQISVFSLAFSGGREQQEKLILQRKDAGWEITKYELSNQHRRRLSEVLKTVELKKSSSMKRQRDLLHHQKIENDYLAENSESMKERKSKGFSR